MTLRHSCSAAYWSSNPCGLTRTGLIISLLPGLQSFTKRQLRDSASSVPGDYVPPDFTTVALQHTNVKLTWDADDDTRKKALRKKMTEDTIRDDDFRVSTLLLVCTCAVVAAVACMCFLLLRTGDLSGNSACLLFLSLSSLQHGEQSLLSFYLPFRFYSLWLFVTNIVGKQLFRRRQTSSCSGKGSAHQCCLWHQFTVLPLSACGQHHSHHDNWFRRRGRQAAVPKKRQRLSMPILPVVSEGSIGNDRVWAASPDS